MVTKHACLGLLVALTSVLAACSSDSSDGDGAGGTTAAGQGGSAGSTDVHHGGGDAGSLSGGSAGSGTSGHGGTAGSAGSVGGAAGAGGQGPGGSAGAGGAAAGAAGSTAGTTAAGAAGGGGGGAGGSGAGAAGAGSAGAAGGSGGAAGGAAGVSGGSGQGGATCDETQVGTPCSTGNPGVCDAGKIVCQGQKLVCVGGIKPGDQMEMCDGLDNDCNGKVDDLDVGGDGICDCLRIGLLGTTGSLPSSNFQAWLEARGTSVVRIQNTASTKDLPLDAVALSQFDVLIVDHLLRPYTTDEAAAVQTWVKDKGRGVVTMTGYANQADPDFLPNVLLAPFGLSYGGALSSGPATVFAKHPVTDGLTSVTFNGGYVVSSVPVDGVTSTPIASNKDGTVAYAEELGKGRLVAWGDEWIEYDSEWQKLPEIEHFWVNLMNWTGPRDSCQVPKP